MVRSISSIVVFKKKKAHSTPSHQTIDFEQAALDAEREEATAEEASAAVAAAVDVAADGITDDSRTETVKTAPAAPAADTSTATTASTATSPPTAVPAAGRTKARKPVLSVSKATRVVVLPPAWFYPMPNDARHSADASGMDAAKDAWVVEGTTKAIHYWECSWNSEV